MAGQGSPSSRSTKPTESPLRRWFRLLTITITTIVAGAVWLDALHGQGMPVQSFDNIGVYGDLGKTPAPSPNNALQNNVSFDSPSLSASESGANGLTANTLPTEGLNAEDVGSVPSLRNSPGFTPPQSTVSSRAEGPIPASGVNESGVNESGVNESGVNESGVNESGVNESGVNAPEVNGLQPSFRAETPFAETPFYEGSSANTSLAAYSANPSRERNACSFRIAWRGKGHVWRGEISVTSPSNSSPNGQISNSSLDTSPVSPGEITSAVSLGVESDQAAAFDIQDGKLNIHHTSVREYDGYQITLTGSPDCVVQITLGHEKQAPQTFHIPLEKLYSDAFQFSLDDARISVRRSASDSLRVQLNTDCMVFSPGDRLTGQLLPYRLSTDQQTITGPVEVRIQVLHAREKFEVFQKNETWQAPNGGPIPLDIPLPREEGVYEVVISAQSGSSNSFMPRLSGSVNRTLESVRLRSPHEIAQRKIQLTVISSNAPVNQTGELETRLVAEIDPTSPRWWEAFERLSQFPLGWRGKSWEGPMGNGNTRVRSHSLGPISELAASPEQGEPCWEAYTFPIEKVGTPHILEIEYPSDTLQTTGISIVEPNSNGAILPSNLDSALNVSQDQLFANASPCWKQRRIIFWPRTKSPILLLYNLRSDATSCFGKIRVMAVTGKLPKTFTDDSVLSSRLFAAYLDRPQFPEQFSGSTAPNENSSMFLDDWDTFYDSASRMIEYLNYVGYNGAMISVNSDGSAIWPCPELAPTPRYDTGTFFANGQDPVRKDVLELLMRLFDRQTMRLIPAMEIASPHPQLETLVRASDPQTSGLQWVGPNGKTILETYAPENGLGMYYNILHPQVQKAVLDVVYHLGQRYRNHPSFAGLSLQLTDNSWLILPPPQWGMDDQTVSQFTADTGIQVPGAGPNRFAERARFLNGPALQSWLNWRSERLGAFYLKLYSCLQPQTGNRKLYLSGAKLFTRCHKSALAPKLPQTMTTGSALLQCGLHGEYGVGKYSGIVLMYTQRELNGSSLAQSATERQWRVLPDQEQFFSPREGIRSQASLFYHPSRRVHLSSFDEKSPFKPTYAALNSVPTPAGLENRRRFASSLANWDTQEFFDGGWLMSVGEEDSLRNLIAGFRSLPATAFSGRSNLLTNGSASRTGVPASETGQRIIPEAATGSQAVVYRTFCDGKNTWAYAINTTPFPLSGRVRVNNLTAFGQIGQGQTSFGQTGLGSGFDGADPLLAAGQNPPGRTVQMENVLRQISRSDRSAFPLMDNQPQLMYDSQSSVWQSNFAPFEMQVVRFSTPVAMGQSSVVWNAATLGQMQKLLYELADRSDSLKITKPMRILDNPDFELPANASSPVPQWFVWKNPNQSGESKTDANIDVRFAANGKSSLRLYSDGAPLAVYSKEIVPEPTGRFTVSLWVKKELNVALRCFLRIKSGKKCVYRELVIKGDPQTGGPVPARESDSGWKLYYFHVSDLPMEDAGTLCLGFELSEPGEAWIDDIQLSDLFFPENEQRVLYKALAPMGTKFTRGELEYCWKYQQGYWPQFLMDCVELGSSPRRTQLAAAVPHRAVGTNAAGTADALSAEGQIDRNEPKPEKDDSGKWRLMNKSGSKNAPGLNLGLGLRKSDSAKSDSTTPTPNANANANSNANADADPPKKENKSLWQRATDWMSWK